MAVLVIGGLGLIGKQAIEKYLALYKHLHGLYTEVIQNVRSKSKGAKQTALGI